MKQLHLLFSREVCLEDARRMKLDYSLTEECSQAEQAKHYYGIRITKQMENTVETEEVSGISHSRDAVVTMLKKLFQYEVTPVSLVEIVDDMVTLGV
jgi:hypothetical protein